MARVAFKGSPVETVGELPAAGTKAPDFTLTKTDLTDITLKDVAGKKVVMNIFPSVDTPVCAASVRRFNEEISKHDNAVALCISRDLPFAHARFCGAEGLRDVVSVSELRDREFGKKYGVAIVNGPLAGLLARAVLILNEKGNIVYGQLVPEISEEPDYDEALRALQKS